MLVWIVLAQPALGATVGVFEGLPESVEVQVRYEAALGEINDVIAVEAPDGVYLFTDLKAAITPLAGCNVNLAHLGALRSQSPTL